MEYEIKCNAPKFERHKTYVSDAIAKCDFFSLLAQFEARGYNVKTFFRNSSPMRGRIQVEIDGFFYYVELFKTKDL